MKSIRPLQLLKENIRHEWVNGDQVHLMQIFSNLLSNAIKYTQEGGEIQLLVEECEIKVICLCKVPFFSLAIMDMGMSADFKDTIFDAFTRAENSLTNKIQGTGLGMAITKNLVEAMGGTIDVDSELGQGSCFEVLMDLKIAEDRTVALAAQEETDEHEIIQADKVRKISFVRKLGFFFPFFINHLTAAPENTPYQIKYLDPPVFLTPPEMQICSPVSQTHRIQSPHIFRMHLPYNQIHTPLSKSVLHPLPSV